MAGEGGAAAVPETVEREEGESPVIVVGVDGSEQSHHALEWTLHRFFSSPNSEAFRFRLVVVHAKPTVTSVVGYTDAGGSSVLPFVESNLRRIAEIIVAKAKELCLENSVNNALIEVVEGDARYALCEAAERHRAIILVLGCHGFGAFKRALLGSVSDYCAHHARCNVMIVKKHK